MLYLAQSSTISNENLGVVFVGVAILIIVAEKLKNMFWPSKSHGDECVGREEFDRVVRDIQMDQKEMNKQLTDMRVSMEANRRETSDGINKAVDTIRNKIDAVDARNVAFIQSILSAVKQPDKG